MIPHIETERLNLRAPIMDDFPAYAKTLMDPERSKYIDGPYTKDGAWKDFCWVTAGWSLMGFGGWSVEEKATGTFLGMVAISKPPSFPEIELGWVFQEEAEGKGYAFEAASAMSAHAFGPLGLETSVSYVDPDNVRSQRLAERLGARLDADAPRPQDDPCLVYRHAREAWT